MSDPRFARVAHDPRFKRPKSASQKVVVDERFKRIFEDDQDQAASSGYEKGKKRKVDKYGRRVGKEKDALDLKKYYRLDTAQDGQAAAAGADLARGEVLLESSSEEDDDDDDEEDESESEEGSSDDEGSVTLGPAHVTARKRSRSLSIDLDEDAPVRFGDDDDEQGVGDDEPDVEATKRIAVVNMDWDNLRAIDLYRALSSALSKTAPTDPVPHKPLFEDEAGDKIKPSSRLTIAKGRLVSLTIYPSEFGRERLEREAVEGPPAEAFTTKQSKRKNGDELVLGGQAAQPSNKRKRKQLDSSDHDDDDSDADSITEQDVLQEQVGDGEDYDHEALRKYQLERLRYYYAIAEFDSPRAARHVYEQINGTEFERTANVFDLQYVPDDFSFDDDPVHDEVTEATANADGTPYEPLSFTTDALQHSKVKLTWDADDPHRKGKITKYMTALNDMNDKKKRKAGKVAKIDEADIAAYLASSTSEEEDDDDDEAAEAEHDDFFEAAAPISTSNKSKKEKERERLRSLFGLDELKEKSWDGADKAGKGGAQGEMQITFAPALSKPLTADDDDDDAKKETALERYKRKEKERKARKRAERQARREGKSVEEVLAANAEQAAGEDKGFADDFFAQEPDMDAAFEEHDAGRDADSKNAPSKKERKAEKAAEAAKGDRERAELDLLIGSDDEDANRHFDMKAIVKAEKLKGQKHKNKLKGKKAQELSEVQDDFAIDAADPRFKNLHDDYNFAIDPSHPRFQKTKNMNTLLDEGRKRRSKAHTAREPVTAKRDKEAAGPADNLDALVQSIKRKAAEQGGQGKRAKK